MFQYREPRGFTEEQARYLREMQASLAQEFVGPVDFFALAYRHVAPTNTFAGQILAADGTDWNPGAGVGIYQRNEANTAWRFVG
jgi:hypothetical protein